jgi:hypothetical protein
MTDGLDRLRVPINSSTPIVVMETSEEMRAVSLVRTAWVLHGPTSVLFSEHLVPKGAVDPTSLASHSHVAAVSRR